MSSQGAKKEEDSYLAGISPHVAKVTQSTPPVNGLIPGKTSRHCSGATTHIPVHASINSSGGLLVRSSPAGLPARRGKAMA
jgi:hypothetical protein